MAAIRYTKADWVAQADIQELAGGKYRGVVLISRENSGDPQDAEHTVEAASDSPEEALEEAKALAHRLLANVTPDERYR
jgi:prephenate dehydrogenase